MEWELEDLKISNKRKKNSRKKGQFEIENESETANFGSLNVYQGLC